MKAMKKFAITLLSVLMCLLACFSLFACGDEGGSGNGGTGGTGGGTGDGGTTPTPTPPPAVITVGEIGGGSFIYNGEEHKPEPSVTKDETALVKGTDYDLTYANNVNAGTASVTVDFKGEYAEETDVTKNFTIAPKAVTPIVEIASGTYTYNGSAHTPAVTVRDGGEELEATDFEVAYANNTNAGTATVTVTLKGNYTGTKAEEFAIAKAKVAKPEEDDTVFTYTGQAQTYAIAQSPAYTVTGNTATNAGTTTVTVALNDNYLWADDTDADLTFDFVIAKAKIAKPEADATVFTYNAQEQTYTLATNAAYTITGDLTATNAGTETITVALINDNYIWADDTDADLTFDFVIAPFDASEATINVSDIVIGGTATKPTISLDGFTVVENVDYTVEMGSVDAISEAVSVEAEFKGNFTGSATTSFKVKPVQSILDNTIAYMNFNGNTDVYGSANATAYVRRDSDATTAYNDNSTYNTNMYKRSLTIKGIYLGSRNEHSAEDNWGSFSFSVDVNVKELYETYQNGFAIPLFTTTRTDGKDGFGVYFRGGKAANGSLGTINCIRIKAGGAPSNDISTDQRNALTNIFSGGGIKNFTFTFDRSESGKIKVKFYLDGVIFIDNWTITVADDLDLGGAADGSIGIGGPALVDDSGTYSSSTTSGDGKNTDVEIDNLLFYNGIISNNEIKLLSKHFASIMTLGSNYTVEDGLVASNHTASVVIKGKAGVTLTGATFSDGITASAPTVEGNLATYVVTIPEASVNEYKFGKTVSVTLGGVSKEFVLCTTANPTVDGNIEDSAYQDVRAMSFGQSSRSMNTDIKMYMANDGLYIAIDAADPFVTVNETDTDYLKNSAFELYFLPSANANYTYMTTVIQIRVYANGVMRWYLGNANENNRNATGKGNNSYGEGIWLERAWMLDGATNKVSATVGVGYKMEVYIPYKVLGMTDKPEKLGMTYHQVYFTSYATAGDITSGAGRTVNLAGESLGNYPCWDRTIYFNFNQSGFAPDRVYDAKDIAATSLTGVTGKMTWLSSIGGIRKSGSTESPVRRINATDLVLEGEGVTFTSNNNGTYNYTITATDSVVIPVTVKSSFGTVLDTFNLTYTKE